MRPSVSIVTASFGDARVIKAMSSTQTQSYAVEHIVVDGGSAPELVQEIRNAATPSTSVIVEPDSGIYDALNKGIRHSTGQIIGLLHADDAFADESVIRDIVRRFEATGADAVYGDLMYVTDRRRVVRYWKSQAFRQWRLSLGWMPPHPTLFLRREVFERIGGYDTTYRISGDYEFILRAFGDRHFTTSYLPRCVTLMTVGGASNRSLMAVYKKTREDIRAMRSHDVWAPAALVGKHLLKVSQFIRARIPVCHPHPGAVRLPHIEHSTKRRTGR